MTYRIETTRRFEKDFKRLSLDVRRRIDTQLRMLETDPIAGKALRGDFTGTYSLRVGEYRVLYAIDHSAKRIILLTAGHRAKVYG